MILSKVRAGWQRFLRSAMLYGALSTGVRVGANFLLLPVLLRKLSESELALWWVFVALGAMANLADFGFGQAITRVYNYLWAGAEDFDVEGLRAPPQSREPNLRLLGQFSVTVRRLYWWLACGAGFLLAIAGTLSIHRSTHGATDALYLWSAWGIYLVAVIYSLGTSHWTLACQGINRVRELQAATMWGGLVYLVSAAALLLCGAGLFATVVATALRGWLIRDLCRRACIGALPIVKPNCGASSDGMLRKLWPNAWKFGLLSVGAYLMSNGTVLVCGHVLDDAATASFGLTVQIGLFLVGLSTLWLAVKWPQLTILRAQGEAKKMAELFARRLALCVVSFVSLAAVVVLFGNPLLEWKGAHAKLLATPVLVVYLAYLCQQLVYGQFASLAFTENVVLFHMLSLFTGVSAIFGASVLAGRFGVWGVVLAPLIVAQFGARWYPVWRGFRGQPLSIAQFVRAAIFGRADSPTQRSHDSQSAA